MTRYIIGRVFWGFVMVLGLVVVDFLITHLLPGDPIDALVGNFPAPPDYIARIRHDFGLDESLSAQLGYFLLNLAHGQLGFSFVNRQPVLQLILDRAGTTLILMLPSLVLASLIGIALAVAATARNGRTMDSVLTCVSLAGHSVPVFWLAQILIVVFAVKLGWLPAQGMRSIRTHDPMLDLLRHLVLPGFCITIYYLAVIARVARASMLEILHQDFVLTARAKGIGRQAVPWRRTAQCRDSGDHRGRLQFRYIADGCHSYRDRVRVAGPGRAVHQLDRQPRLSSAVGYLPARLDRCRRGEHRDRSSVRRG